MKDDLLRLLAKTIADDLWREVSLPVTGEGSRQPEEVGELHDDEKSGE